MPTVGVRQKGAMPAPMFAHQVPRQTSIRRSPSLLSFTERVCVQSVFLISIVLVGASTSIAEEAPLRIKWIDDGVAELSFVATPNFFHRLETSSEISLPYAAAGGWLRAALAGSSFLQGQRSCGYGASTLSA